MANNLIKNETKVFYTVVLQGGLYVRKPSFYSGRVEEIQATKEKQDAYVFADKDLAIKVKNYTNGSLIKHTRTTVVTEVTEEIEVEVIE